MSKNKKQKSRIEKEIVAKTAAMFEVTSTPSEQISSLPNIDEIVDKAVIDATNKELEEMHETEINEAKELGMSDSIIVESTVNEISKDFESKIEELQNRYLEATEDKNNLIEENKKLKNTNEELVSKINSITIDNETKIQNLLTEIDKYKNTIQELQRLVTLYTHNESNYKMEIANLRSEISSLKQKINSNMKNNLEQNVNNSKKLNIPIYTQYSPNQKNNFKNSINGYSSWN